MSSNDLENKNDVRQSVAERLLTLLKTRGELQASDAGHLLGTTGEAARQQFVKLAKEGLVEAKAVSQGVGRPSQFWQLTAAGQQATFNLFLQRAADRCHRFGCTCLHQRYLSGLVQHQTRASALFNSRAVRLPSLGRSHDCSMTRLAIMPRPMRPKPLNPGLSAWSTLTRNKY